MNGRFKIFGELSLIYRKPITPWKNIVPRAFSSFKMAVGETPGQGC